MSREKVYNDNNNNKAQPIIINDRSRRGQVVRGYQQNLFCPERWFVEIYHHSPHHDNNIYTICISNQDIRILFRILILTV